jgi:general stress protein CsbA
MLVAADYPFLNVFWTMIIFFCWVAWIWTLILIFGDLFSRRDRSGWYKAVWMIFLIVLPFLGVLIYLIADGRGMSERSAERSRAKQAEFTEYVQTVAGSGGGSASEIATAKELLDSGALTQAEFESLRAKALA